MSSTPAEVGSARGPTSLGARWIAGHRRPEARAARKIAAVRGVVRRVRGKRAMDVGLSALALGIFAPVTAVAAALIRAEDGGPVWFVRLAERPVEAGARPVRLPAVVYASV